MQYARQFQNLNPKSRQFDNRTKQNANKNKRYVNPRDNKNVGYSSIELFKDFL